ncbi:MAG: DUF3300 domain-containing protein [Terracidiphilus sp.]
MSPQFTLRLAGAVHRVRQPALAPLLFALSTSIAAQQPWPQNPQYAPGQYPQNQQPAYPQQPYAAPNQAPNPEASYDPRLDPDYDPGYGPGSAQPNYPQPGYAPQAQPQVPVQQPLSPDQLEQLVAPIALYPDTLVAQILAAATYPAQVVGADHWVQSQGYASPDQIAYAANAEPWDPSVKALTAFPQVLALLDHDLQWTTDLGNAYYNQPQDVLQTIQVLRQRAQSAGTLQNTPQESVDNNQGYVQIAPTNPEVVSVPAYNPWDVYGQPIQPYSGFSLLGSLASFVGSAAVQFGPGVAMAAFNHTPFGWATWALNWLSQSVLFHQSNYVSRSTTVAHWNYPSRGVPPYGPISRPRPMDAYNRGAGNYGRPGNNYGAYNRPSQPFARTTEPYAAYRGNEPPNRGYESPNRGYEAPNRGYQQPGNYGRPAQPAYAYNRPQETMPVRPQTYGRPAGSYGSSFYGNSGSFYAPRPATAYARQQALREPTPQFNTYGQRQYSQPYSEPRSYAPSRSFAEARPEHSGGFHPFSGHDGGSFHESYHAPKAPKMPKEHGGGGHSFGGGHSSGGSHHSGGHHF